MKYAFVESHPRQFRIAAMCRALRVARSGFYAWVHKPLSDRAIEDQRLLRLIRASNAASNGTYEESKDLR